MVPLKVLNNLLKKFGETQQYREALKECPPKKLLHQTATH